MQLGHVSQPMDRGLAALLIPACLVSGVLVGWGIVTGHALTSLVFLSFGTVLFVALTKYLPLLLMEITIFVSVVLGWSFQFGLSPFSLLGWGVTYNDILLVLCIANWALLVFSGRRVWPEKQLAKPLFLYSIYMVIPILYTVIRNQGDIQWILPEIGYLFYYLLIFPFSLAVEEKGAIDRLTRALLISIIVAAVLILLYNLGVLNIPSRFGRGFAGGRVRITSEEVMLVGFFFALAILVFGDRKAWMRMLALLAFVSSSLLMLLSQTRTLLLSVPVGLITFFFVMRARYKISGSVFSFSLALSRSLVILLLIGVVILGIFVLLPEVRDDVVQHMEQVFDPAEVNPIAKRLTDITILLPNVLAENPITGIGIGRSWEDLWFFSQTGSSRGAHSIWVYLFVKTGIVGLLLFLGLQFAILRTAYTIWADRMREPISVAWGAGMLTSVVATLSLSSFFAFLNLSQTMTIIYCLFIAIMSLFIRQERSEVS